MDAITILKEEHKNILKIIESLKKEIGKLEKGKEINNNFFSRGVSFIRNYADKFHHAKEEDILFRELGKPSIALHCNPTEQMLYEHKLGREFVNGIERGLKQGNKAKIIENTKGYIALIQEHIFK